MSDFHGLPTGLLETGQLRLEYLTTAGPRIVRLSYQGSPNLLADVHDLFWKTPHGDYHLLGGHRLWISPELPEKTYIPDKTGVQVQEIPNGVELTGASETGSGVKKSVRIELDAERPALRLIHTIVNENPAPITIAPWAITLFRLGGTVILPQPIGNADPHGLLSNRILALWPYTRINDPRLNLRDDFILLRATADLPPVKIGYFNPQGWIAYWLDGVLFIKRFESQSGAVFPDRGCNTESYCNDRFIELESLGALMELKPGKAVSHVEIWELFNSLEHPSIPSQIQETVSGFIF